MIRFLLLQVRDPDDPMLLQERDCFRRAVGLPGQWRSHDLLGGSAPISELDAADVVMIGGSGNYSVVAGGSWLAGALQTMRTLVERGQPTFASCWGFQALAAALGGEVVTDPSRAELGDHRVRLTDSGVANPVFAPLAPEFDALMGHQDIVERLPGDAVLLASTEGVRNQAFCLSGKPIYATQFHPELTRRDFIQRVTSYPQYIRDILGLSVESFSESCQETPLANSLLPRFVRLWEQSQTGDIRLA